MSTVADASVMGGLSVAIMYSIAKEREELGCNRISLGRQCVDEESVYLKGTRMSPYDTNQAKLDRLQSIVSYHEKGAVWRRCLVMALVAVLAVHIVYTLQPAFKMQSYTVLLLVNFVILYFYHNYVNFHHFRLLKNNACEILDSLRKVTTD